MTSGNRQKILKLQKLPQAAEAFVEQILNLSDKRRLIVKEWNNARSTGRCSAEEDFCYCIVGLDEGLQSLQQTWLKAVQGQPAALEAYADTR
jgi:hypothetical protein